MFIKRERVVIWGTLECGEKVIQLLKKQENREIVLVVDKSESRQGQYISEYKIEKPEKLFEYIDSKKIDAVIFAFKNKFFKEVTALFKDYEGIKGYIVPRYIQEFQDEYDEKSLVEIDLSKPRLKQFDVNLVDHCNMKCKGCLRFSNLVTQPVYADFDNMIADWKRIKELFWGVERIKLMGGEPMLSPDLCKYIELSRKIFPDADIMVTTNALLINDKCTLLFEEMKKNHVFFDISLYEPMEKQIDRVEDVLKKNGVWYTINHTKGDFYKVLCREPRYDMDIMYENCTAKNCHHLREGKISVCSRPQYIHIMNDLYHTNLPSDCGVWNIYDLKMDAWELDQCLSRSFEACKYCAPPEVFEWGRADEKKAQMSDWFVD